MARKRPNPDEIVAKLRQVEVLRGQPTGGRGGYNCHCANAWRHETVARTSFPRRIAFVEKVPR